MKHPGTQFLRAVAILLILNSHLDKFYPLKEIASGGAIGNSIFFFLSAFGLSLSQQRQPRPFVDWYSRRVVRIYPSLWIVLISMRIPLWALSGHLANCSLETFLGFFLNPPYWFLQTLLVFCFLCYPLLASVRVRTLFVVLTLLALTYAWLYVTWVDLSEWSIEKSPFDRLHYLMVFIFGVFIARQGNTIAYSGPRDCVLFVLSFALMYGHKALMLHGAFVEWQFLQHAAIYPMLFSLFKISNSRAVTSALLRSRFLSIACTYLSTTTLEIYMVHETISASVRSLPLRLPANLFVFLLLTFLLSSAVRGIAARTQKRLCPE